MAGAANSVLSLLLEPGSSTRLVPVINLSLLCLLIVLAFVYFKVEDSLRIHVAVMGTLAVGLMGSVNWVASMYQAGLREEERTRGGDGAVKKTN